MYSGYIILYCFAFHCTVELSPGGISGLCSDALPARNALLSLPLPPLPHSPLLLHPPSPPAYNLPPIYANIKILIKKETIF